MYVTYKCMERLSFLLDRIKQVFNWQTFFSKFTCYHNNWNIHHNLPCVETNAFKAYDSYKLSAVQYNTGILLYI